MTIIDSKFDISQEIVGKCTKFANDSTPTSVDNYARRNQKDPVKIAKDIRNGKIAEELVYAKFSLKFPNLSTPDYNIYAKGDKSWEPDLKDVDSHLRIAVKSQELEAAQHYGESWTFQFGNGKQYDCDKGVFGKDINVDHYASFVLLNVPKRFGIIRGIVKIQWLHDKKLFKHPQKKELQGIKLVVYYEDLIKYENELWQL